MKNIILFAILMSLLSCTTHNSSEVQTADMPITMSLEPAVTEGFEVSVVKVTISRNDYVNSIYLDIEGETASGTFYGLVPGIYQISVEVYEEYDLIATGTGEGEVIAGETTSVTITIIPYTGDLEIIIDWGEFVSDTPMRVLFIGNSISAGNGGVDLHTMNLALTAHPETEIICSSITNGGYTLEMHYNTESTLQTIAEGQWDYVILQEQSVRAYMFHDIFYEYAILLDEIITESGAETAFFFSWNYDFDPEMLEFLSAAYNHIGNELDAPVIPVGRAFQLSMDQNSLIELFGGDGIHSNHHGTYLAACTFFTYFWNENPVGLDYVSNESISIEERNFLQDIAYQTYQLFNW